MLRVVFDTNVIISGSLWSGAARRALEAAQARRVSSFISETMLDELNDVIHRPKFSNRLTLLNKTPTSVIADYLQFAEIIEVEIVYPLVAADSDDDHVLACAFSAQADCIVSGDPHLLSLETIRGIVILSVSKFLQWIESEAT